MGYMIDENGKAITFLCLEEKGFVTGSLSSKGATAWKLDHTPVPEEQQQIFQQNIKESFTEKLVQCFKIYR